MFIKPYQLAKIGSKIVANPEIISPLIPYAVPIALVAGGGYLVYKYVTSED